MTAAAPPSPPHGLLRQVLERTVEGVALSNAEGRIVYANAALERMLGCEPGALAGRPFAPQDRLAELLPILAREGGWEGEWRAARADGGEVVIAARISRADAGGAEGWLVFHEDVSRSGEAAAALREVEARLELATSAADIGVWDWDLVTNTMIYSERAKAICGFPPGEPVTYEMVAAVTHPDDFPQTSAQAARVLDPNVRERSSYHYRLLLPDNRVRWVRAFGEAVFEEGPDGPRAVRYAGTLEDITDQKTLEEELQRSQARLSLAIDAGRMAVWTVEAGSEEFVELFLEFGQLGGAHVVGGATRRAGAGE